jgi:hypothetical protein
MSSSPISKVLTQKCQNPFEIPNIIGAPSLPQGKAAAIFFFIT